jgi:hypothetical protein
MLQVQSPLINSGKGKYSLLYILLILLATSCSLSEEQLRPVAEKNNSANGGVTLNLSFQNDNSIITRALTDAQEQKIDSLRVFVFDCPTYTSSTNPGDPMSDIFMFDQSFIQASPSITGLKVPLGSGGTSGASSDYRRFIVVANMPEKTSKHLTEYIRTKRSSASPTITARDLLANLIFETTYWEANKMSSPQSFPMYGQSNVEPFPISQSPASPSSISVKLVRALAKVQISVDVNSGTNDPALGGANYFELKEIYACNVSAFGNITPDTSMYAKQRDPNNFKITKPYMPKNNDIPPATTMPNFSVPPTPSPANNSYYRGGDGTSSLPAYTVTLNPAVGSSQQPIPSFNNTIYLPERDSIHSTNQTPTFLILKAKYYGTEYYYPVHFTFGSAVAGTAERYTSILRNHTYKFNIIGVRKEGFQDYDLAYAAGMNPVDNPDPLLIIGDASSDPSEKYLTEIKYNKNYYLAVSTTKLKVGFGMYNQEAAQIPVAPKIYVKTNYPGGWEAKSTSDFNMVKNSINGSYANIVSTTTAGNTDSIFVNTDAYGRANQVKEGTITIKAGELTQVIKIKREPASYTYMVNSAVDCDPQYGGSILLGQIKDIVSMDGVTRTGYTQTPVIIWGTSVAIPGSYPSSSNAEVWVRPVPGTYGPTLFALVNGTDSISFIVWHVPQAIRANPSTHTFNGYEFMDYYLGCAFNGSTPTNDAPYFQWGRMNAFGFSGVNYSSSNAAVTPDAAIKRPFTFYTSSAYPFNWSSTRDNNLWRDVEGEKGPYDPCPVGWRVPPAETDVLSPWHGFTGSSNGLDFSSAKGGIDGTTGTAITATPGYVWSASQMDSYKARAFKSGVGEAAVNRANAHVIRCVRDNIKRFQ